jgi:hypothetical protein
MTAHIKKAPTASIIMPTMALKTPLTGTILNPMKTKPTPPIKYDIVVIFIPSALLCYAVYYFPWNVFNEYQNSPPSSISLSSVRSKSNES